MTLRATAPFFFVRDVVLAAAYYRERLGFTVARLWNEPPSFCIPQRDNALIMLCQDPARVHPNGDGTWDAYVWLDEGTDALFEELRDRGADIVHAPEDRAYYGNREFAVRDLDGHVIAFAHTVRPAASAPGGALA